MEKTACIARSPGPTVEAEFRLKNRDGDHDTTHASGETNDAGNQEG
jgi:hypothetical protein